MKLQFCPRGLRHFSHFLIRKESKELSWTVASCSSIRVRRQLAYWILSCNKPIKVWKPKRVWMSFKKNLKENWKNVFSLACLSLSSPLICYPSSIWIKKFKLRVCHCSATLTLETSPKILHLSPLPNPPLISNQKPPSTNCVDWFWVVFLSQFPAIPIDQGVILHPIHML